MTAGGSVSRSIRRRDRRAWKKKGGMQMTGADKEDI